jgi:hypothetical protein
MVSDTKEVMDPYDQFQPEDRVKHPVFGEGQILERRGSGKDTKLLVRFTEEGEKRLMAAHAKLKKIRPVETEVEKPREVVKEAPKSPVREPKPAKNLDLDEEGAEVEAADGEDLEEEFEDEEVDVDVPEEEV